MPYSKPILAQTPVVCKLSNRSQRINLICLPFSGASVYSYRNLTKHVADVINVIPVELPGRGKRASEPLLSDIQSMTDDLFLQIKTSIMSPYAFYGHSLGALLGYLLVKRILNEKLPPPLHLFFSGRAGPSVQDKDKDVYALPKKEFIQKLKEYDGSPQEILNDDGIMVFFEPILRADFKAIAWYQYEKSAPFEIPITVMIGSHENTTYEEALKWQDETSGGISIRQFPGGHFFIFQHFPEIGNIITQTIQNCLKNISD